MIRESEEKMCIYLSQKPNEHLLILGQSGTGKTYFCVRRIEEAIRNNKQIVIFDYSGSFTMHELQQARFAYCREVKYKNPIENGLMWNCSVDNYVATLSNAFIKSLKIKSYYQRKLIKEAIEEVGRKEKFSIYTLKRTLEKMYEEKEESDERINIGHLLTRLVPYEELDGIVFDNAEESVERKEIEIIQLSGYGEQKPGSSLAAMLREGRKFSLAVYMSSQFLGNYSSEEIDTLMQAGNMLFFKPVPKERRLIAKYIDSKNWRQWEVILDDLNIGEAVLKGHFIVGQNQRVLTNPIKCSISLERGIENANLCAYVMQKPRLDGCMLLIVEANEKDTGRRIVMEINVPVYNKINLSIKEAAAYSNVGENTIRRLLAERGCPFLLKIGNRQLVKRKEFENFLEARHFL